MFGYIVLAVVLVVVVAGLSPPARRFFKSLLGYAGAQLDNASEGVSSADPLGQLKSLIANAIDNGRNASKVVDKAAQQLVSLDNQIADELKEQQRLTNRLQTVSASGDPNKTAEKYALDLDRVEQNLAANQEQRKLAQASYDDNLHLIKKYEQQVVDARKDAESLGFQLEQSAAEKDLNQLSAALKDKLNMGDLSQARRRVQDQIDANKGAARSAHDLSATTAEDADDDLDRKARAATILARFQKPAGVASQTAVN